MINFFKKLFAAIFGKKKPSPSYEKLLKEEPIVLLDEMKMPKESYMPTPITDPTKALKSSPDETLTDANEMAKAAVPKKKFFGKKTFFPFTGTKRWQMRNNRLHIEYNGTAPKSSTNMTIQGYKKTSKIPNIIRPGAMYKGKIDSLKCNRLERAEDIIGYVRDYVERAVFTDKEGNQHQLI